MKNFENENREVEQASHPFKLENCRKFVIGSSITKHTATEHANQQEILTYFLLQFVKRLWNSFLGCRRIPSFMTKSFYKRLFQKNIN